MVQKQDQQQKRFAVKPTAVVNQVKVFATPKSVNLQFANSCETLKIVKML